MRTHSSSRAPPARLRGGSHAAVPRCRPVTGPRGGPIPSRGRAGGPLGGGRREGAAAPGRGPGFPSRSRFITARRGARPTRPGLRARGGQPRCCSRAAGPGRVRRRSPRLRERPGRAGACGVGRRTMAADT
eukprot:scaffold1167_cov418-Prasinococcus_capsulatus_cf.AAC.20